MEITSATVHHRDPSMIDLDEWDQDFVENVNEVENIELNQYTMDIVEYIAGYIVEKQISKFLYCDECEEIIFKLPTSTNDLIQIKEWGKLRYPPKDITMICAAAEKIIVQFAKDKINYQFLCLKTIGILNYNNLLKEMDFHIMDRRNNDHKYLVIKLIINLYFKIRFHFMTKKKNLSKIILRRKYKKLTHFSECK